MVLITCQYVYGDIPYIWLVISKHLNYFQF